MDGSDLIFLWSSLFPHLTNPQSALSFRIQISVGIAGLWGSFIEDYCTQYLDLGFIFKPQAIGFGSIC